MGNLRDKIKSDIQIKKFCLYGFLKNLKFFEPYLLIFLMANNINMFQIGILISIREIIINIFEIPSGFIADYFGRKKELCLCFIFYIISFIFFFLTKTFLFALFGMVFFGLGEAFRSGTHKAMIYTYLDRKSWQGEKRFVYGRTRSFSLKGSAISSILSIILILNIPARAYIFLFSIIPYIMDFVLILSYPSYLDGDLPDKREKRASMTRVLLDNFRGNKELIKILIDDGIVASTVSYTKDLIQPILELIIVGSGIKIIGGLSTDDNLGVILGLVYACFNLFGSFASKYSYKFNENKSNVYCLNTIHIIMTLLLISLSIFVNNYFVVVLAYLLIYSTQNIRKPIFVAEIDSFINKDIRATVLSIASQLKSLILVIVAPILGYLAHNFGMRYVMISLSLIFIVSLPFTRLKNNG